ncbi:phosphate/phosphite/phosphonate ABC transporter substrate-binding protein [Tepidimonas sp.]|uniref:phosphate/phosphite/phosphonate ABC transporter substrate-binding protein n=1 Tax=Tepidimonas sp. TaxID=2002775 RepID=UPI002FE3D507
MSSLLGVALSAALGPQALAQSSRVRAFGVVPYLTARRIEQLYAPIAPVIQRAVGERVVLLSAPNYGTFFERCGAGEYDVIATSPVFGRLAELEQGYVRMVRPRTELEPLLVVAKTSPLQRLKDLRGAVVTAADPLATITVAARRFLVQSGLTPGRDVRVRPTGSHANSLAALLHGESAAAIVSATALKQLGDYAERVRVLAAVPPTPPLLYLAHGRLGAATIERLAQELMRFANDDPAGVGLMRELGHDGLKRIEEADMKALDALIPDVRRLLRES